MRGKCIEDFVEGQVDISRARTVTETDVVTYAWLSGDTNPMHTDAVHGGEVANRPAHRARHARHVDCDGASAGLGYLDGSAIAALGVDEWKFLKPILFGDTVHLRATVVSARTSSKPDRGRPGAPDGR